MKTKPGSGHRHKTKAGVWYDKTDVDSGALHTHEVDLSTLTAPDIATLKAKLGFAPADHAHPASTFSFTTKP